MRACFRAAALSAALAVAMPAFAQQPDPEAPAAPSADPFALAAQDLLPRLNRNRDSTISRREFEVGLETLFRSWDQDDDLLLLPFEQPSEVYGAVADRNGDRIVEYAEHVSIMLEVRRRVDANRDKTVSASEWRRYLEATGLLQASESRAR